MPTTTIETNSPLRLSEADLKPRGKVHPSPISWRDQILYFLLPDRFSDGKEHTRPAFNPDQPLAHQVTSQSDKARWMAGGKAFQGGTIAGLKSKLDYLAGLGVTTLWVAPIWKQRKDLETYHGYGIQNFLEIDPRFGTREALRELVDAAHDKGMYVLLDIIYNHTGNNWFYSDHGQPRDTLGYRYEPPYPVHGWRSENGQPMSLAALSQNHPEDGVWPEEFQDLTYYTKAGQIGRWDPHDWEDVLHSNVEFRRGDFYDLKDLDLLRNDVLSSVIKTYQYWIALSDCDGFRIDTVKHVPWGASRNFCGAIHEYTESIGKENFLLLGEVTGGTDLARDYLEIFGRNIDAVLDIGDPPKKLMGMTKGFGSPQAFFDQFKGHDSLGSHRETGRYHVAILDDHDMVGRDKHRFAAGNTSPARFQQIAHTVGTQLSTLGIPCIYYGTEQAFDGTQNNHDHSIEAHLGFEDRYVRESMFGGTFGAFQTQGCHFFDEDHPVYTRIAAIARLRQGTNQTALALKRGRQYERETSFLGRPFSYPGAQELIAWSRILFDHEVIVALNTHGGESRGAHITVDPVLSPVGDSMSVLYRGDWTPAELKFPPTDEAVAVTTYHGRASVRVDLPPSGMMIMAIQ